MSAIADRIRLSYVQESAYGANPGGTFQQLRVTSESLAQRTDTTESRELRSDRQVADVIRTDIGVEGGLDFELSYGAFDDLIAAVLGSAAWTAADILLDTDGNLQVVIDKSDGTIVAVGLFASGVAVGDWLELSNLVQGANNTLVRVIELVDNDTIKVAGLAALADETRAASAAAANAKIVRGANVANGTTLRSFTFERGYLDLTKYSLFRGLVPESMSLSLERQAIVTGSIGFMGKDESALSGSSGGSSHTAASTNAVLNSIDNILGVIEGAPAVDAANSFPATQLNLEISNNLRARTVLGSLGPQSYGAGKFNLSGSLTAYFNSQAAADKYLAFTKSGLSIPLSDADGNRLVIDIPRVRYTNGPKVPSGENTDIMLELEFTAYRHETEGNTIRIFRFPAA